MLRSEFNESRLMINVILMLLLELAPGKPGMLIGVIKAIEGKERFAMTVKEECRQNKSKPVLSHIRSYFVFR